MANASEVGLLGIGIHLPEQVRGNDWWDASVVQSWREKPRSNVVRGESGAGDVITDGARRTLESMKQYAGDVFQGAKTRRVMKQGSLSSEMELAACRDAIERSGIAADEIELLLVYSQLPDYLIVPQAPLIHKALGLSPKCLVMDTNGACNSFLPQLALAEPMVQTGAIRKALLVQSCAVGHLCRPQDHHSVWFGDGATAEVVGKVSAGKGTLAWSHRTDGSFHKALVAGTPSKRWLEVADTHLYIEDRQCARNMMLLVADLAKEVVDDVLAQSQVKHDEVGFYASHQPNEWFRKTTQEYIGLKNARYVDSFSYTGSLSAANIPFVLGMGEREGLLRDGDIVTGYTGGSGINYTGIAMRWGK